MYVKDYIHTIPIFEIGKIGGVFFILQMSSVRFKEVYVRL